MLHSTSDPAIDHHRVEAVSLTVSPGRVAYEAENAQAIARHWRAARAARPSLFDGVVFFVTAAAFGAQGFQADCVAARYATLHHWIASGRPALGFRNIFGAAALRSSDGALLFGRMAPHTANAGRVYFPGGGFDQTDLAEGRLDPRANILREASEETGLPPKRIALRPGFQVLTDPTRVVIAAIADLPWDAEECLARIGDNLHRQTQPEFCAIHIARNMDDVAGLQADPYAVELSRWIFANG
jgi:8-oxo-dGTP pyrophosphatase MutT (NUDIX family)